MKLKISDARTGGELLLFKDEHGFDRMPYIRDKFHKYFTIVWNPGEDQTVTIDGNEKEFPSNSLLTLLFNQTFSFEDASTLIAWQFNREFYCIIDHDSEVSCVGFLFSTTDHLLILLEEHAQEKLKLLSDIFIEELKTADHIQHEILVALLKRLIVYITGLAKLDYVPGKKIDESRFHTIRKFNLLVEAHFKSEHMVNFYAQQLFKSPKTLSNLFALFNQKSPSQIIQDRIILEAKRLLSYTDKSVNQITYELGFNDVPYFSNFFKKKCGQSPSEFRNILPAEKLVQ
ncbi:AraC family transcriptional regulator [Chitinophaga sp. Cy-1792]|uniref:helix-turn-helix transcriptional regulator n=1 Tax=Chitinophaga sp. Cy-1792 TaxID=2608339 RepID=UPI0014207B43|nr:AraC family transcriptional regulator [Chitinophaga sp. Cy-1792]NIG53910.1 helix-turn-helix transcriptional regulator [Chitinophaga sp. Cy-1792]